MKLDMAMPSRNKPKILLIADLPDWIFARHCQALKQRLSGDFDFTIKLMSQPYNEKAFDLIYPLSFDMPLTIKDPSKYVTAIRSHRSWRNKDLAITTNHLTSNFQSVHVVSKRLYKVFKPFIPGLLYISNGVDTDYFKAPAATSRTAKQQVTIGWAGKREDPMKGFDQFIAPLQQIDSLKLVTCDYRTKNLNPGQMRSFYNDIDIYVCASSSEGNNNTLLEAAAMGKAIITTNNGAVAEYLTNNQSALIVDQELPCLINAAIELRDNPNKRLKLGQQARKAVVKKFDWKIIAEDYRQFFFDALGRRRDWQPKSSKLLKNLKSASKLPRAYMPEEYPGLLKNQQARIAKLEVENKKLRGKLKAITNSKTWLYGRQIAKIKALKVGRRRDKVGS